MLGYVFGVLLWSYKRFGLCRYCCGIESDRLGPGKIDAVMYNSLVVVVVYS